MVKEKQLLRNKKSYFINKLKGRKLIIYVLFLFYLIPLYLMKSPLKITLLQSELHWEDRTANLHAFTKKIEKLEPGTTDLIILPEMFTTGFSMNTSELAEPMGGPTSQWMQKIAQEKQTAICGSVIINENGVAYNRLLWVFPDARILTYDKRHCFTLAGEQEHFEAGTQRLIVDYKGWKICPLICYDLRFPVWSRNTEAYDLLLYVANWPNRRSQAWKSLLLARAIENQSYTIGVNRVGLDENGLEYSGDSAVIDFGGKVLYQVSEVEDVFTIALDLEKQESFRKKLAFLADQDAFTIN